MDKVIFACLHNAGRSQMAAAFFNQLANPGRAHALSAGTAPADRVHPVVVAAMHEVGIDLAANRPQRLTAEMASGAALLVTMGCGDQCPYVAGLQVDDWPVSDPRDRTPAEVQAIRDEVRSRVSHLVRSRGWALSE